MEKEFLADDELWDELSAVENDLIDSYVRGELPEHQRSQFERHFLDSPEKHEQLEMARSLMDADVRRSIKTAPIAAQEKSEARLGTRSEPTWGIPRVMSLIWGATALAMVVLAALLVLQNRNLKTEVGRLQSQQALLQGQLQQLQQQISNISIVGQEDGGNPDHNAPLTVSALLIPGLPRRPGQPNTSGMLRIAATTTSVLLRLELERDRYRQYQVVIETPEGNSVSHTEMLKSEPGENGGRVVSVRLPSAILKKGDYIVTLSGQKPGGAVEVVDSYSLSVIR